MEASAPAATLVRSPSRILRALALGVRNLVFLLSGFVRYWRSGQTPTSGHQALIWLSCATGRRVNDLLSSVLSVARPKVAMENPVGVLGDLREGRAQACAAKLRSDGHVLFERALPDAMCDRLIEFASRTPASLRRMDHEQRDAGPRMALFDADRPLAVRYDYDTSALLDHPDVQALLADPSLLCLVQEYLGCEPVADVLSMWWHAAYHAQPDSEAAQFFHFDMDRIKWLKIFVYLTDVGPENGPHSFITGSHRTGGIPPAILARGYVRLTDEEVFAHYGAERRMSFTAPRGSIIVEDTRGLHKGVVVRGSPRLILQLQFSNSLFGARYPRARIGTVKAPALARMLERAPRIYRQYS